MDDLISRQAAIDALKNNHFPGAPYVDAGISIAIGVICDLPSAQPERTGRWINHVEDGYVECPFCHSATNCDDNVSDLHFCFSCGADMRGK